MISWRQDSSDSYNHQFVNKYLGYVIRDSFFKTRNLTYGWCFVHTGQWTSSEVYLGYTFIPGKYVFRLGVFFKVLLWGQNSPRYISELVLKSLFMVTLINEILIYEFVCFVFFSCFSLLELWIIQVSAIHIIFFLLFHWNLWIKDIFWIRCSKFINIETIYNGTSYVTVSDISKPNEGSE